MKNILNKFLKNTFKNIGINISRVIQEAPSAPVHHQIDLLFDIGANDGGYAGLTRMQGYKGKIVSFEPLPIAYQALLEKSKNDPKWIIHNRCAIGSEIGQVEINVSENSYSSSILPMLEAHSSVAPTSIYIGKASTDLITLDSVFDSYRKTNEKIFLKIDTQGFEKEVINGASKSLKNIFGVQLELSIIPLYENQELYSYFFKFFEENGFFLWSLIPGFHNPATGQSLQFDAIFIRNQ